MVCLGLQFVSMGLSACEINNRKGRMAMIPKLVGVDDPGMVEAILNLEKLFPERLDYGEEDVRKNLADPENMNIVALNGNNEIIGYILCIPHNRMAVDLKNEDPLMRTCSDKTGYIDQIAVIGSMRERLTVFKFLIESLAVEGSKRGYVRWSSHLIGGLEGPIRGMYKGKVILQRKTVMPSYGGNVFTYMEGWV